MCVFNFSTSCLLNRVLTNSYYYSQVFALRRPLLHKVLDYEDEFFALLMAVLESHSLRTTGLSSQKHKVLLL